MQICTVCTILQQSACPVDFLIICKYEWLTTFKNIVAFTALLWTSGFYIRQASQPIAYI